jgi:hypothetical protein
VYINLNLNIAFYKSYIKSTEENIQGVFHREETERQITGTVNVSNQGRQFKLVQCKPLKENDDCALWMEVDTKIE